MMDPKTFLSKILPEDCPLHIRAIGEKPGPNKGQVRVFAGKLTDFPLWESELRKLNDQGYGIFFSVNGCAKDADCQMVNAQFVENDTLPLEEQLERLHAFPLPPSIITRTRKSQHAYYLIKDGEVSLFRHTQSGLIKQFDGDPANKNESRFMRLPGFFHQKEEPLMVEVIEENSGAVYMQEEMLAHLPQIPERESAPQKKAFQALPVQQLHSKEELDIMLEHCQFLRYCREHAAFLSEPLWRSMIANLICFENGENAVHELSKDYPRYSFAETQKKIETAKSGYGPITCDQLKEYGFHCEENCPCKAPAAYPYYWADENWEQDWEPWYDCDGKKHRLNPSKLARTLAEAFPSIFVNGGWHMYARGVYQKRSEDYMKSFIGAFLHKNTASVAQINEVYELWRLEISTDDSKINSNESLINIKNGIYFYRHNVFIPNNVVIPEEESQRAEPFPISTIQLNISWDPRLIPAPKCTNFMKFIDGSFLPEDRPVVQEMMGYCLCTSIRAQKAFVLLGPGGTGKSTLLTILQEILGREHCSSIPLQNLEDRFKTAQLDGKLLNVMADISGAPIKETSILKSLVSGDSITVEHKGQPPFSMVSKCKMLWSANALPPSIGDRSTGFFRRFLILEMGNVIPSGRRDPYLAEKLLAEREGIFYFAMEGLRRLAERNFQFDPSENSKRLLERYREDSDNVLQFIHSHVIFLPGAFIEKGDLYEYYTKWCTDAGLMNTKVALRRFNETVKTEFAGQVREGLNSTSRRAQWEGLRYSNEGFPTEEESRNAGLISPEERDSIIRSISDDEPLNF